MKIPTLLWTRIAGLRIASSALLFFAHATISFGQEIGPTSNSAEDRTTKFLRSVRVTHDPSQDGLPAWSPIGDQIAFVSDRSGKAEVWVVSAAGGDPRRITTNGGSNPTWSPDGTQIAFVSDRGGNKDIWVIPSNGGQARRLTKHRADDIDPAWSPSSDVIAFSSYRKNGPEIWLIGLADSKPRRLTKKGKGKRHPTWSPDGLYIAFTWTSGLWAMPAQGGPPFRISRTYQHRNLIASDWAPNGIEIAADVQDLRFRTTGLDELWFVRADSGNPSKVRNWTDNACCLSWSPNGEAFVVSINHPIRPGSPFSGSQRDLWVVSTGTVPMQKWVLARPTTPAESESIKRARDCKVWGFLEAGMAANRVDAVLRYQYRREHLDTALEVACFGKGGGGFSVTFGTLEFDRQCKLVSWSRNQLCEHLSSEPVGEPDAYEIMASIDEAAREILEKKKQSPDDESKHDVVKEPSNNTYRPASESDIESLLLKEPDRFGGFKFKKNATWEAIGRLVHDKGISLSKSESESLRQIILEALVGSSDTSIAGRSRMGLTDGTYATHVPALWYLPASPNVIAHRQHDFIYLREGTIGEEYFEKLCYYGGRFYRLP